MLDKEAKVQGVGVYAEFTKPGSTYQIFITPDCYTHAGTLIPMSLHRRVVTPITPKKQWKQTTLRHPALVEVVEAGQSVADENISTFTEERVRYALPLFYQLLSEGWTLRNKPLLIEISRYDADDIAKSKTPNKAIYRIHISRKAQGFPAELV
jgi:hypothetical protein